MIHTTNFSQEKQYATRESTITLTSRKRSPILFKLVKYNWAFNY